jgi:hypothetical protein
MDERHTHRKQERPGHVPARTEKGKGHVEREQPKPHHVISEVHPFSSTPEPENTFLCHSIHTLSSEPTPQTGLQPSSLHLSCLGGVTRQSKNQGQGGMATVRGIAPSHPTRRIFFAPTTYSKAVVDTTCTMQQCSSRYLHHPISDALRQNGTSTNRLRRTRPTTAAVDRHLASHHLS